MSSIDEGAPNLVRVGRDPGANAGSTRASVAIGFGSPSGDTGVTRLDLNDVLVRHPQATFLMRVAGDAMREIGIDAGDIVLVDPAQPRIVATFARGRIAYLSADGAARLLN